MLRFFKNQPVFKNQLVFLRQFGQQFETTGSLLPSSRFLAQAITRYLAQRGDAPIRVLECGPGTGAFTDQIVRQLRPGDQFDLVELNEAFVDVLQTRFATESAWQWVNDLAKIHQLPLQEFIDPTPYDFIISGLPHVNFPPAVVETITTSYFRLLKPGGTLSYFEYMYIRPLKKKLAWGATRRQIHAVDKILAGHLQDNLLCRDSVFCNVPPAWVQHLRAG
jgi:phospholipid N-methyltransferase